MQDRWSKYEYNPLTREFNIDEPVVGHDHEAAINWVQHLNFKTVVEPLIIKKIKNPLMGKPKKATSEILDLFNEWINVIDSVRGSVWDSVGYSVWGSVWDSVGYSVRGSVWDSVGYSVRDSVRDSVGYSVRDSVGYSVEDSVWVYISSFFKIKYERDFSSDIKLWNSGFVPSFDGKTWRLHSGKDATVVYEKEV